MSLAALPAATLLLSAVTYKLVWFDEKTTISLRALVDVCLRNSAGWFKRDHISSSFYPQLNDVLCARMAFLNQLFRDRSGNGAFLIYGSILFPLILRLSYKAASPNTQNTYQGLILPSLAFLLTSSSVLLLGTGLGVFIPPLISLLYLAGATYKTTTKSIPLPAVTRAVYGANLATVLTSFLFFIQFVQGADTSPEETKWWEEYISKSLTPILKTVSGIFGDVFPLVVSIPLVALGLNDVKRPTSEETAIKYLKDNYLASEVAYGFERTWAYYRQAGLLSSLAYAYGMSRIIKDLVFAKVPLSPAAQYLLLVSLSLTMVQLSIAIIESQTISKDAVDEEARKAIAKAPAGNPGVEDNPRTLAILALLVGPSLPAMLWAARGEEIRGWKGRRAWRLATAEQKAIK